VLRTGIPAYNVEVFIERPGGSRLPVTERRRAEAALREDDERFRALIDISAQIVWTADAEGAVVEDSPGAPSPDRPSSNGEISVGLMPSSPTTAKESRKRGATPLPGSPRRDRLSPSAANGAGRPRVQRQFLLLTARSKCTLE
jgi:hypothetical protein